MLIETICGIDRAHIAFPDASGAYPDPFQALLAPIGQSAVDIAKRVSSKRDQTFRCTVFHYTYTGVAFYSLVHSASWEFHGAASVYLYLSRAGIIKKSIIWYRECAVRSTWCFARTCVHVFYIRHVCTLPFFQGNLMKSVKWQAYINSIIEI